MFKARRPVIGTKNGHHIKTGGRLCQIVLRQIFHGDPTDLELFSGSNGLGGMTEPIILSGFNLNKDKGLGNGKKSSPPTLLGDNINFPVTIPVIPLNNAIPGFLKVPRGQIFTPLPENRSP